MWEIFACGNDASVPMGPNHCSGEEVESTREIDDKNCMPKSDSNEREDDSKASSRHDFVQSRDDSDNSKNNPPVYSRDDSTQYEDNIELIHDGMGEKVTLSVYKNPYFEEENKRCS